MTMTNDSITCDINTLTLKYMYFLKDSHLTYSLNFWSQFSHLDISIFCSISWLSKALSHLTVSENRSVMGSSPYADVSQGCYDLRCQCVTVSTILQHWNIWLCSQPSPSLAQLGGRILRFTLTGIISILD